MWYIFIIVSVIFSQNKNAIMSIKGIKENVCFGYIARAGCSSSLESNAVFSWQWSTVCGFLSGLTFWFMTLFLHLVLSSSHIYLISQEFVVVSQILFKWRRLESRDAPKPAFGFSLLLTTIPELLLLIIIPNIIVIINISSGDGITCKANQTALLIIIAKTTQRCIKLQCMRQTFDLLVHGSGTSVYYLISQLESHLK